jgi:hypothetical protein
MFLLYYFIKAMGWGGGADLIILVICTFWGVRGGGCRATCLFLVLRLRRRGVFLVLVQNFAARGLVQKPSNYSLSSVRYIEKKHKKQQKSLHLNIKKFLSLFLFNNSLEPTN